MIFTSTHASHLKKDSDTSKVHSVVGSHLDASCATRLGALSASPSVRNVPPVQGVERLRPFRHVSFGQHPAHFSPDVIQAMILTRLSNVRLAFLPNSEDNVLTLASPHPQRSRSRQSLAQENRARHRLTLTSS